MMFFDTKRFQCVRTAGALCGLAVLSLAQPASAKHLCVNASGANGCSKTISAAVAAANPGDQIQIGPGEYSEGVVVDKPLALIGAGAGSTLINAKGQPNGVYIDGLDHPGLSNVLVTGLAISNANYEGILITNTSNSVIANNRVVNNDQNLNYGALSCPGLPAFETNEGEDCGEGVHLTGTFAVTVANNVVELNAGGILLSDETGETFENLITGNTVQDNVFDCGITLASHKPAPGAASKSPYGVVANNIVNNRVSGNGTVGAGAGVGIFAPGPGNLAFENKVIGNIITNNGQAGVAMHNHAAPPGAPSANLNDNVILGNTISGNGQETEDAATPGTTGINIYGLVPIYAMQILENNISNEDYDVVIHNPGGASVHLNNLLGNGVGLTNLGTGAVDGTLNYFGCPGGPTSNSGCSTVSGSGTNVTPVQTMPISTGKGRM